MVRMLGLMARFLGWTAIALLGGVVGGASAWWVLEDQVGLQHGDAVQIATAVGGVPAALVTGLGVAYLVRRGGTRTKKATYPNGIVWHADEVCGLAGRRVNLTESHLRFVAPTEGSDTHPDRLLSLLSDRANAPGVLLVGKAGVGKTRTCFEVGARADKRRTFLHLRKRWTVLHVRSGEQGVTAEELGDAIAATRGDVLVIIDYLSESNISLSTLRTRVLPDARRDDRHVALLASARTGWYERVRKDSEAGDDLSRLFRRVELDPDDAQRSRIRDTIIESLAGDARRILGAEKVKALCGTRPIIATLVAAELQASAERGTLTADGPMPRSGELIGWLQRRLDEDGQVAELWNDDLSTDRQPSDNLLAIAAMVAAAPQEKAGLLACARKVLDGDDEEARHLLASLRRMDWLVGTPQELTTVHDIVADYLLSRVLLRSSGVVRGEVVARLLSSSLSNARSIGRYATSLGRVVREPEVEDRSTVDPAEELERGYADWLQGRATQIGGLLLAGRVDESAAAITALIRSPASVRVTSRCWDELLGPWFETYGGTVAALRVLERGLETLDAEHPAQFTRLAIRVLNSQSEASLEEDHLLCALLDRDDLVGDLGSTTQLAFRWLDQYGTGKSASFLLRSLLRRRDLPPDTLKDVGERAREWLLRARSDSHATGFVLRALLEQDDMPGEYVSAAVDEAFAHVEGAPEALATSFVLAPLIGHPAAADRQDRVRELGLTWLERHGGTAEARFVLNRYLHDRASPVETVETVEREAFAWLQEHGHGEAHYARPVLVSLLERVGGTRRQQALDLASRWLAKNWERAEASYVLEQLIRKRRPLDTDTVAYALDWLREHGTTEAASYVLRTLLARPDLATPDASKVIEIASRWLKPRSDAFEARFVLATLLERPDLPERVAADHTATALRWLEEHRREEAASHILEALLQRRDLGATDARQAVKQAVAWFKRHPTVRSAWYIFLPLLRHPELDPNQRAAVAARIPAWIDANEGVSVKELNELLKPDYALPGEICTAVADRALAHDAGGKRLRWPLHHGSLDRSLKVASSWLETRSTSKDTVSVLRALLDRNDVVSEPLAQVVTHALDWLDSRTTPSSSYGVLLHSLLRRHDELTDEHFDAAATYALSWLDSRAGRSGYADGILCALLDDPRLTEPRRTRVKTHARR